MILNIEELYSKFEILNDTEISDEIFNENETLEGYSSDSFYNKRWFMSQFFKRFTVSIENAGAFEKWKNEAYEALDGYITEHSLKELTEEERELFYSMEEPNGKEEEQKKVELFEKLKKISNEKIQEKNKLENLIDSLTIENWKEGKAPNGMKLNKLLRKRGMPQTFLDWSSTQEKSDNIVQVTINPTAQAVAGMSNFAESGSWNGYGGTSCQDTRLGGSECFSLIGAVADDRLYTIQLSYLEDNEGLTDYIDQQEKQPRTMEDYKEILKNYDLAGVEKDILYSDNMQDNLRARTNARAWELDDIRDYDNSIIKEYQESGIEFNFLKCVSFYGSNKTKQELKNALDQIKEVLNIIR